MASNKKNKVSLESLYRAMLRLPDVFTFERPDLRVSQARRALGWLSVMRTACEECAVRFHPVLG